MGVNNKLHLEKITISGEKNLHLSNSDLRSGSRYILASVPSGDYYLKNAKISHYWRFDFDASNWQFSIKPGKINYIGDIVIDNPGYLRGNETFEFINRSSYALEFLESEFPRLLESSKVTYAGPGTDNFIEFIQERY